MTRLDLFSVGVTVLAALILAPHSLRYGQRLVRGCYPKKGTFEYNRGLTLINVYNWLSGAPIQGEPYAWQWKIIGYIGMGLSVLCALWVPYAVYLLIKG